MVSDQTGNKQKLLKRMPYNDDSSTFTIIGLTNSSRLECDYISLKYMLDASKGNPAMDNMTDPVSRRLALDFKFSIH